MFRWCKILAKNLFRQFFIKFMELSRLVQLHHLVSYSIGNCPPGVQRAVPCLFTFLLLFAQLAFRALLSFVLLWPSSLGRRWFVRLKSTSMPPETQSVKRDALRAVDVKSFSAYGVLAGSFFFFFPYYHIKIP